MKQLAKRSLSLLLALVMCLSVLTCIQPPQAEAASYTYNWGTREDVADQADFTRSTAEEWYAKQNTSYEELSQLSGSANTSSVTSSALYQKLRKLMQGAVTDTTSYEDIKTLCKYTDCQNGGGKISSFYSGREIGPSWDGTWNREHTWPNSKGDANGSGENDIFMLRPTHTSENSSRGNTAYGKSGSYYNPNSESGGKYDLRGDVARIVLFVYVRWQNYNSSAAVLYGNSGVIESRAVLLEWMEADPVDTWELGRNDSCQSITGTRNVFVDYPELAFLMLGADVPDNYTSPSGIGGTPAFSITAKSNNTSYGTVSLSGKTITATPKTGYYASGYTVTSGQATVTQEGNTFRVTPTTDCTITINFAAKTAVKLSFMENGVTAQTISSYGGDAVTLPSNKNAVAEGYTFIGWTDRPLSDTTTKPTIYNPGASVTAANKTYYALYTYSVGGTGVTEWTAKDITQIKSGDVFVITMSAGGTVYALPNATVTKGPTAQKVTVSNGKLTAEPSANLLWNLGGSGNALEFYPNDTTSQWLNCNNDNNGVSVGTGTNKTFKINSGYLFNNGTNRYVGVYVTNPDWRCYTTNGGNIANQTLGFYVRSESGTLYYTTSTYVCKHEDTGTGGAKDATCTESGFTEGLYCNDCDSFISGHEEIPALGHSWGAWVETTKPTCTAAGVQTATCTRCSEKKTQSVAATGHSYSSVVTKPTETEQGYTTHTCTVCGYSYKDSYVDALGGTFYVSFEVPDGVAAVETMVCNKNGITLPTANTLEGYSFLGWTTAPVEDTESKPTVLTGSYNTIQNVTLYALYSYAVGGSGNSDEYTLHSGELTEGDYVIYYKTDALVATTTDNGRLSATAVTVSNDTITKPDASIVWHITPIGDGYYTIYNETKGVYAAGTGTKNKAGLLAEVTDFAKWTLSGDSTYEFTNVGNKANGVNALLRWNSTSIGWACYSGSTGGAVSLYKASSGTTYYTTMTSTEPAVELTHISLDPNNDALGYKADAKNLPEGAKVQISLWVTEDIVVTKDATSLRLKNILANNGGEMTIYAKATIVDAEGEVIAESAVAETSMKEIIVYLNANGNQLDDDQQGAVYNYYMQYAEIMSSWLDNNDIEQWV